MPIHKKQIRAVARVHGYWLYQHFLQQTETWPLERRQAYVLDRLRQTLIRAYEGIPFYRQRFDQAGFNPRNLRATSELQSLPLLTKEEVRQRGAELIDRRFSRGSVVATTSGTTGQPTMLRLNEKYVALDYACMFRHWAKAGYRFRAPYAALRSYVPAAPGEPLWKYNRWQNTLYMSAYHLKPGNSRDYVEALAKFRPAYIRGYPSSLNVLAEFAYPYRDQFAQVRGLFTASETLLASERAVIERTFGQKLYDWYGMTEPAVVITERADHQGMEVEWEYGLPEFLAGDDLLADERRLVATSLHNPVMPLIRYDTGDIVRIGERGPERGPWLYPPVRGITGRKDDCLLGADGRRLPSLNFYSLLQDYSDILRFQFVQAGLSQVTVRLSIRPGAVTLDQTLDRLAGELRKRLGPDFALEIKVTEDFVCGADGKTPTFIRTFVSPTLTNDQARNEGGVVRG